MFIQTEKMPEADSMKFIPGTSVLNSGEAAFGNQAEAGSSPLAQRLFEVDGVVRVSMDADSITVGKTEALEWDHLKAPVLGAIMDHFNSGAPTVISSDEPEQEASAGEEAGIKIVNEIKELIETRIKPAAEQNGGDVAFNSYKDGIVYLEMMGPAVALKSGIENMLQHYIPEVQEVRDHRDAIPKPGLETPVGLAVKQVIDERINPSVSSHGGHIALVDVQEDTVYIRLEGGCQGCGMADVTLKQGIEVEIIKSVPQITAVRDTTDHADGSNPYFSPGK
jgi:Fe-S cluster biogenesis protein NfuA